MGVGDALEIVGLSCLVAAGALYVGWPLGLLAAGVAVIYLAQCYTENFKRPKLPAFLRRHQERQPTPVNQDDGQS